MQNREQVARAFDYLEIEYRVFQDYPCPRAICVVDEKIVYIGMYEWTHSAGTPNPAFRLDRSTEGEWAKVFLSEAQIIDEAFSKGISKDLDVITWWTAPQPRSLSE